MFIGFLNNRQAKYFNRLFIFTNLTLNNNNNYLVAKNTVTLFILTQN